MKKILIFLSLGAILLGCSNQKIREYEGIYTYGHEIGIFYDEETKQEYWLYSDDDTVESLNKLVGKKIKNTGISYPEIKLKIRGIDKGKATNGLAESDDRKMKVLKYEIIDE